ncbi:hypothetical protein TWF594_006231 [Orbilia oligospora]|nr:hypothetical protein TWF706_007470 [Orbilia oligospora]KAF3117334.1 hypothetical protein TWF103_007474 [Orbilia oligospora]KAF3140731.1 hypothetical protein TWF594_006231 [Orbilia oligospora]
MKVAGSVAANKESSSVSKCSGIYRMIQKGGLRKYLKAASIPARPRGCRNEERESFRRPRLGDKGLLGGRNEVAEYDIDGVV